MSKRTVTCLLSCLALSLHGCDCSSTSSADGSPPNPTSKTEPSTPPRAPITLFTAQLSAYATSLALDDEAIYLFSKDSVHRVIPGHPVSRWALDLGVTAALLEEHFIYWSSGALRRAPKRGGEPSLLAKLEDTPQKIVSSGDRFAWMSRKESEETGEQFFLRTLDGAQTKTLYSTSRPIVSIHLEGEQLIFAERLEQNQYHLGAVSLSGGPVTFTAPRAGRAPSMLTSAGGDLFYYEGQTLSVRRLSTSLTQEQIVIRDLICSPLTVSTQIFCAEPGKIYRADLDVRTPQLLAENRRPITALVASPKWVAWLVEEGAQRLALQLLPLDDHAEDRARPLPMTP